MKILVAYDGSIHADDAIEDSRRAALPAHADAMVISVSHGEWRLEDADAVATTAAERLASYFPGRIDRLLRGSVSSYAVSHARCSVEIVRDVSPSH